MSVLRKAFETRSSFPIQLTAPDISGSTGWQQGMVWNGYPPGVFGTPDQAMRLSAVYACLRLISETIATLPLDTFIRFNGSRAPFRPRPDYLNFNAPGLSKIDYLSQVLMSLLTNGNAYVLTPRNPMGEVTTLVVLDPTRMVVERSRGKVTYKINGVDLDPATEVMHIKGISLPGALQGISPIAYAAETIGVGLSAQGYGASFFQNGALPSLVIETPGDFKKEAGDRWIESWNARHQGIGSANKVGVLTNGAKMNKVSISPEEAQFIATRQFTVPDIARIYGVPPHLIADASNSTSWGSGLAEQNTAFGSMTLRPWTERIEEAHGRLLTGDGMPDVFIKLNMDAVLRASLKERFDAYAVAIQAEIMVPNEARKLEDMPPVKWGDVPPPTNRRESVTPQDSNTTPGIGKPMPIPAMPASNGGKR